MATYAVATNIALLIDSLWVAGIAGMLASLSFAEWRRSLRVRDRRSLPATHAQDSIQAENVVSIPVTKSLTFTGSLQDQQLSSIILIAFLVSLSVFSLGLVLAAWLAPTGTTVWQQALSGILFALSITQTIAAVWKHFSTRTALAS